MVKRIGSEWPLRERSGSREGWLESAKRGQESDRGAPRNNPGNPGKCHRHARSAGRRENQSKRSKIEQGISPSSTIKNFVRGKPNKQGSHGRHAEKGQNRPRDWPKDIWEGEWDKESPLQYLFIWVARQEQEGFSWILLGPGVEESLLEKKLEHQLRYIASLLASAKDTRVGYQSRVACSDAKNYQIRKVYGYTLHENWLK